MNNKFNQLITETKQAYEKEQNIQASLLLLSTKNISYLEAVSVMKAAFPEKSKEVSKAFYESNYWHQKQDEDDRDHDELSKAIEKGLA